MALTATGTATRAGSDTLTSIENLTGGTGTDTVTADNTQNDSTVTGCETVNRGKSPKTASDLRVLALGGATAEVGRGA